MEKHFEWSDAIFEQQFSDCTLDPALFGHEAHLRLAWIHINKYGIDRAIKNICLQIQNFAARAGAPDKYNETVTIAAIRAVYHFMLRSDTDNFQDFILENSRLKTSFKQLLNSHYRTDIFNSERAKRAYIEPELLPFD